MRCTDPPPAAGPPPLRTPSPSESPPRPQSGRRRCRSATIPVGTRVTSPAAVARYAPGNASEYLFDEVELLRAIRVISGGFAFRQRDLFARQLLVRDALEQVMNEIQPAAPFI